MDQIDPIYAATVCTQGCGCCYLAKHPPAHSDEEGMHYHCFKDRPERKRQIDEIIADYNAFHKLGKGDFCKGWESYMNSTLDDYRHLLDFPHSYYFTTTAFANHHGISGSEALQALMKFREHKIISGSEGSFWNVKSQEEKVIAVLADKSRFNWRSAAGIADQIDMDKESVERVLSHLLSRNLVCQKPQWGDFWGLASDKEHYVRSVTKNENPPPIPEDPQPIDFIVADMFREARHHALGVCNSRPYSVSERAGHFVTSLRRCMTVYSGPVREFRDLVDHIRKNLLQTHVWKDVAEPHDHVDLSFPYEGEQFIMTAERIERWKYLTEDEQAKAGEDIDATLRRMKEASDNAEFHATAATRINNDGERVLDNLTEALESANV